MNHRDLSNPTHATHPSENLSETPETPNPLSPTFATRQASTNTEVSVSHSFVDSATGEEPPHSPADTAANYAHYASGFSAGIRSPAQHFSLIAVQGSVPTTPLFNYQDDPEVSRPGGNKNGDYFLPGPKGAKRPDWDSMIGHPREMPPHEVQLVSKIEVKNNRVIAIDFDDVFTQNYQALQLEINKLHNLDLTIEDAKTYFPHQNRGWGNYADVGRGLRLMEYLLPTTEPVDGFVDGLKALRELGHELHIVTSRAEHHRGPVIEWLAKYGVTVGDKEEDLIKEIWFVGTYDAAQAQIPDKEDTPEGLEREKELNAKFKEVWKAVGMGKGGQGKLKVLRDINAAVFIDDHYGNLLPILNATPPIPCILFTRWPWSKNATSCQTAEEIMTYEERLAAGVELSYPPIEDRDGLVKCETWNDIVNWVAEWDQEVAASSKEEEGKEVNAEVESQ
ncbi:hypothetical protein M231_04468 [Tremella mesenterica]|uniref:Uncharacterized protein n=1 Tax=Tremella mesenterica TaxID=5217 RepID=A0A4Q1BKM5_TREME|nr:hypothetical protein M231_04468 [Tremella mesenterica]